MSFDIFKLASGATHPEDTVTIVMDDATAYRIRQIEEKLNGSHRYSLTEKEQADLEKESKALRKKLDESKAIIHLQGVPIEERSKIDNEVDKLFGKDTESDAKDIELSARYFLAHYRGAEDAKGNKDETEWDLDKAKQFWQMIPDEARQRLVEKTIQLSLKSDNYEHVETSASFS